MRTRLVALVAALALVASACGSDEPADAVADPARQDAADGLVTDLVSARDTLPPAPPSADALTVVLTHPAGAGDPGIDAAASALAQRPDIDVHVAVAAGTGDATTSGFPVETTAPTAAAAVVDAIESEGGRVDLVVVGVTAGHGIGPTPPEAAAAVRAGVPALVVGAELAEVPDHAAATMQLLEVLDLELGALVAGPAVHRLSVPSCERGMLRGRLATRPAAAPPPDLRADCASTDLPRRLEAEAFAVGYATLTRLR